MATRSGSPDASAPKAGDDVHVHVGAEVRAQRVAQGLSVAELARRSDVSRPFISQLESGRNSISLPTLYRVAAALNCSPNVLLGVSDAKQHFVGVDEGQRIAATEGDHAAQVRVLSRSGPGVALEAYHYTIRPDDDEQAWYQHPGEDFVYVLAGSLEIEFGDGGKKSMNAGESLHHDGTSPHRWRLAGEATAEILIVVSEGRVGANDHGAGC